MWQLVGFLSGFRGRSFVALKSPAADAMRYHAHARMRESVWLECGGEGFVVVNETYVPCGLEPESFRRRAAMCRADSKPRLLVVALLKAVVSSLRASKD